LVVLDEGAILVRLLHISRDNSTGLFRSIGGLAGAHLPEVGVLVLYQVGTAREDTLLAGTVTPAVHRLSVLFRQVLLEAGQSAVLIRCLTSVLIFMEHGLSLVA
jgi:hypothetical protein